MKKEPKYQNQHKVPQVYLKQFGYQENNEWKLSVYKVGKTETENVEIAKFTAETNIFDLPFADPDIKRHFENQSNRYIENYYRTIISNLHNQKRLTEKNKDVLNHFVANMLCRTNPFRAFINELIENSETKEKFINEITMFSNQKEINIKFINLLKDSFKIDFQLNIAICMLMDHLVHTFKMFKKVVIRDCEGKGWFTTDSPVHLDKQGNHEWIIPLESEIYLPLSKDFCLYMFHSASEVTTNPLRSLSPDKINSVNFETFDKITKKIISDFDEYLIFNKKTNPIDVTK